MQKIVLGCVVLIVLVGGGRIGYYADAREVVVFTALDQIFSEPILQDFEKATGITVKAVYDIEATKTTGLVNRLIAEKKNPQCDVFWNNEVIKSIILKRKGIITPYVSPASVDIPIHFKDKDGYWTGFAARARVLVINTELVDNNQQPDSIFNLTDSRWKGKIAIANPLFGTTSTHVAALFSYLGKDKARQYFENLKKNQIRIVDGNSVVKDQVGAGELKAGFTDTDDVNMGLKFGMPLRPLYPDKRGMGTLLIPNTVSLIANCPNPNEGKELIDYLLSKEVEKKLAFSPSVQMPLRPDVPTPENFVNIAQIKAMEVNYEKVADEMDGAVIFVQNLFIR
ncbi:MAG: extracellular solute-binding protein [Thermodesulfobacteriota bacterium]|nr:extracellular solute-binding protein [Thermodesulfobacteriota bacterium]